jgi:hypothetical protein
MTMTSRAWGLFFAMLMILFAAKCSAVTPEPVPTAPIQNFGFTGGVLVIPFKFHPSDKTLSGGGTFGGYIGWKSSWEGLTITPVLSTGLAMADAKYGVGVSAATGLIGSVYNSPIHFGFIGGTDYYARSVNYPYEGKLWLAFEIGYSFGQ